MSEIVMHNIDIWICGCRICVQTDRQPGETIIHARTRVERAGRRLEQKMRRDINDDIAAMGGERMAEPKTQVWYTAYPAALT